MAAPAIERMTVDAFIAWESEQEPRYELVDGVAIMMTGSTRAHDVVRLNIASLFKERLRGKPCRAHLDVKVRCPSGDVRYPEAMIDCGQYRGKDLVAPQPTIVVEVLSPSTRATDFLAKLKDYESVPSISIYAIFWQDEARVIVYRRNGDRLISAEDLAGLEATVEFSDVEVKLALADVYEDVFDEEAIGASA